MGFFFKKSSIYNVRMVITEEKILSNIDKVKKLINPNSKKQIIKLEEDKYFKDLIEAITTYLTNYPKKDAFPMEVYKAAYDLVEFATNQFEDNNKKISKLLDLREENVKQSYLLNDAATTVREKKAGWIDKLPNYEGKFSQDVAEALTIIANSGIKTEEEIQAANKLIDAKIQNLSSNLFIEVDLNRIEDLSKALSYIGIEIAEALKYIPMPDGDNDQKKNPINFHNIDQKQINNMPFGKSMNEFVNNENYDPMVFVQQETVPPIFEQKYVEAPVEEVQNFGNGITLNTYNDLGQGQVLSSGSPIMGQTTYYNPMYNYGFNNMQPLPQMGMPNVNQQTFAGPQEIKLDNGMMPQVQALQDVNYVNGNINANVNTKFANNITNDINPNKVEATYSAPQDLVDNMTLNEQNFFEETRYDVKPTFFEKFKKSKIGRFLSYIFNIKVVIDYPMLTEGE